MKTKNPNADREANRNTKLNAILNLNRITNTNINATLIPIKDYYVILELPLTLKVNRKETPKR